MKGESKTLGGVKFVIELKAAPTTTLAVTDRAGQSYYVSGNNKTAFTLQEVPLSDRQQSLIYTVKIVDANDASAAPSVDALAAVAGTYHITATAAGSAKISLTETESLGTSDGSAVNFANPTSAAEGALGAIKNASVGIMTVVIGADGGVTHDTTAWADVKTAVDAATVYYGLEAKSASAEQTPSIDAASITAGITEIA